MKMKQLGLLALMLSTGALWGGLGDRRTILANASNPIPEGWVLVGKGFSGPRLYTPHFPTTCTHTIMDVRDAPYGFSCSVLGYSPIPPGWVVTYMSVGAKDHYSIQYTIRNVNGAPEGTNLEIEGFPGSPVPPGWTITSRRGLVGSAKYPKLVITKLSGPAAPAAPGMEHKAAPAPAPTARMSSHFIPQLDAPHQGSNPDGARGVKTGLSPAGDSASG